MQAAGTTSARRGGPSREWLVPLAWIAFAAALYFATARRTYFYDSDTSTYLELARSLAAGDGYVFDGERHTKFPPGVPLLLAPFVAARDGDFALLYRASACVSLAALAAAAWWFRERGAAHRGLLLGLCAASAVWYEFSTGASLSEAPFALVLLALFALVEHATRRGVLTLPAALFGGALVLCAVLLRSAGIAVVAGALATWLHHAARRSPLANDARARLRGVLLWLPGAVAAALWFLWTARPAERAHGGDLGHESSYFSLFALADPRQPDLGSLTAGGLVLRALDHFAAEGRHVAEVLTNLPWISGVGLSPVFVLAAALMLLGLRREFARANPLAAWTALAYTGVVVLWPYDEGRRFVMPLAPAVFVLAASGLSAAADLWRRLPARRAASACVAVSALGLALSASALYRSGASAGLQAWLDLASWALLLVAGTGLALFPAWRERLAPHLARAPRLALGGFLAAYALFGFLGIRELAAKNLVRPGHPLRQAGAKEACAWIREHAEPDACVLATDHAAIRYATRRRVALLPVTANRERLAAALADERPDYVVINAPRRNDYFLPREPERLRVLQELLQGRLAEVARTERVSIWRVAPE